MFWICRANCENIVRFYNHEGSENEAGEAGVDTIQTHLHWDAAFTKNITGLLKKENCIEFTDGVVKLTDQGRLNSVCNYEALFS